MWATKICFWIVAAAFVNLVIIIDQKDISISLLGTFGLFAFGCLLDEMYSEIKEN